MAHEELESCIQGHKGKNLNMLGCARQEKETYQRIDEREPRLLI